MLNHINKIRACACIISALAINSAYAEYSSSSVNANYNSNPTDRVNTAIPADRMNANPAERSNANYTNSDRSNTFYAVETESNSSKDFELANSIRSKIGAGIFSNGYDQVNVKVINGVVTLDGFVATQSDKEKVEKEVRNMDGVQGLVSNILIQDVNGQKDRSSEKFASDTFSTPADDQLNKKIRDNVSRGWLWDSYKDVRLNTNNGVVTLEGVVNSSNDQQKLINELQKIEGVKSVINHLRLNK